MRHVKGSFVNFNGNAMKFVTGLALNIIFSVMGPIQEINIIFINLILTCLEMFVGIYEKNTNNMFS